MSDAASLENSSPENFSPLESEEYVEQSHFFRILGERLADNTPAQDVLVSVREEVLATTKLPMAIDFLLAELKHLGMFSTGMKQLQHYFTPFQCYVMSEAENDRSRFDLRVGLEILSREAAYRTEPEITRQGLFLYQLETLCRNRLGYDLGLEAMAADPSFDKNWQDWILIVRRQIGIVELADLIYVRSDFYDERRERQSGTATNEQTEQEAPRLFGTREGRIAWANRQKDPLVMFAALHRQLGYPEVPRTKEADPEERLLPVLARRVEQLEGRLKLLEEEQRGGIQLEKFYANPNDNSPGIG